jgi:hypothetical protein
MTPKSSSGSPGKDPTTREPGPAPRRSVKGTSIPCSSRRRASPCALRGEAWPRRSPSDHSARRAAESAETARPGAGRRSRRSCRVCRRTRAPSGAGGSSRRALASPRLVAPRLAAPRLAAPRPWGWPGPRRRRPQAPRQVGSLAAPEPTRRRSPFRARVVPVHTRRGPSRATQRGEDGGRTTSKRVADAKGLAVLRSRERRDPSSAGSLR